MDVANNDITTKDFISAGPRIIFDGLLGGQTNQRVVMSSRSSGKREFIVATGLALMLGVLLSFIAVYGLNRYFGSVDEIQTTGTLQQPWTN
jgi:hypothetical protein